VGRKEKRNKERDTKFGVPMPGKGVHLPGPGMRFEKPARAMQGGSVLLRSGWVDTMGSQPLETL